MGQVSYEEQDLQTDSSPTFGGIHITGDATIGGDITIAGDIDLNEVSITNLEISDSATIGGDIIITGEINQITTTGDATIGDDLFVGGDGSIDGNLDVFSTTYPYDGEFGSGAFFESNEADPVQIGVSGIDGTAHVALSIIMPDGEGPLPPAQFKGRGGNCRILLDGHAGACNPQQIVFEGFNAFAFIDGLPQLGESSFDVNAEPNGLWDLPSLNLIGDKVTTNTLLRSKQGIAIDIDDGSSVAGGIFYPGELSNPNFDSEGGVTISSIAAGLPIQGQGDPRLGWITKISYNGNPDVLQAGDRVKLTGGDDFYLESESDSILMEFYQANNLGQQYYRQIAGGNAKVAWLLKGDANTIAEVRADGGDDAGIGYHYWSSLGKEFIKTADDGSDSDWYEVPEGLSGFVPTSRTVNGHALSSDVTVTSSDVGLGNVDNTSDANKPVSTAQATAIAVGEGLVESINGDYPAVVDGIYYAVYKTGYAGTINNISHIVRSLSTAGTFNVKINGTDVTSLTSLVPTVSGATDTATGANTFAAGDTITIVFTGTLLVVDFQYTLKLTRS